MTDIVVGTADGEINAVRDECRGAVDHQAASCLGSPNRARPLEPIKEVAFGDACVVAGISPGCHDVKGLADQSKINAVADYQYLIRKAGKWGNTQFVCVGIGGMDLGSVPSTVRRQGDLAISTSDSVIDLDKLREQQFELHTAQYIPHR